MKYVWISLLLLSVILIACICGNQALRAGTDQTLEPLNRAISAARSGQYAQARGYAAQAAAVWTQKQAFFSSLLCHDETDVVTVGFAALKEVPDADFLQQCSELLTRISHIREMDLPYLYNLL